MSIEALIYGLCSTAFALLIVLMVLRGRVSRVGLEIIVACTLTAVWSASSAFSSLLPYGIVPTLDSVRLSAWLIVAVNLVEINSDRRGNSASITFLSAVGFCAALVAYEALILLVQHGSSETASRIDDYLHLSLSIAGLLATENLLRNTDYERRRAVWPLCLALGGTFSFELFLYADRVMVVGSEPVLYSGRGLIGIIVVPLFALAMARNREWRVDIHVSRTVVLHTAALVATGAFFVALAAAGLLVRQLGGKWGPWLQLLTLAGAAVVLVAVMGSRDVRIQFKRAIARNFFSHRFDYRIEWLRFVDTVSQRSSTEISLLERIIRGLAQIVESPAGVLWSLQEQGGYSPEAGWNLPVEHAQKISSEDPFIAGFRDGSWIQERVHTPVNDNAWPLVCSHAWLAIPLPHGDALIGFVMLAPPTTADELNWESFDLLRAAARQAASYLAEERSTRALLESRQLTEFSKQFVFVIHDMKNLATQLGLLASNARRYLHNPEFRDDMLMTLEDAAGRMNRLLTQLHAGAQKAEPDLIEPDLVIAKLARELSTAGTPIEVKLNSPASRVAIGNDQFRSVMSHLITNAREASRGTGPVIVASRSDEHRLTVDVVDKGPGMDEDFIRNELFRPFRSHKQGGLGIGGYQTRELLRVAGAELEVISEKGVGTTMRVIFPMHRDLQGASPAV